jgi:multidrug efflux pump
MGLAVFGGMIGATAIGLFMTPFFYILLRALSGNRPLKSHTSTLEGESEEEVPHVQYID